MLHVMLVSFVSIGLRRLSPWFQNNYFEAIV